MEPDPEVESMGWLHDHRTGRFLLSLLLLAMAVSLVGWNLPKSGVRDAFRDRLEPPVNAAGLNQGWEVFAPNPPRTHIEMTARVTFDDGSTTDFGFPDGEPFFGAFREYRWRKWERRIRLDKNRGFRGETADWIAREFTRPDQAVSEVVLVRRSARTPDIGSGDDLEWTTEDVYVRTFYPDDPGRSPSGRNIES